MIGFALGSKSLLKPGICLHVLEFSKKILKHLKTKIGQAKN